jgi:hypothetical protein
MASGINIYHDPTSPLGHDSTEANPSYNIVCPILFKMILQIMPFGGVSSSLSYLDDLYLRVSRYTYGGEIMNSSNDWHSSILAERNPSHLLVQLNTILSGSSAVEEELNGYKGYLLKLRAIASFLSFGALQKCLERAALAKASHLRLIAVIVLLAFAHEQVLDVSSDHPETLSPVNHLTYQDMRSHLMEYLFYYLKMICSKAFPKTSPVLRCLRHGCKHPSMYDTFWSRLSQEVALPSLKRPARRR